MGVGLALVLGQLVVFAPGGYEGAFTVSDRSEARIRSVPLRGNAIDVETVPTAVLTLNGRRSDFTLGYGPRIAYLDLDKDRTFVLANAARIAMGFLPNRQLRLEVLADGTIGKQVTAGLVAPQALGAPVTQPVATNFVPPNTVINSVTYRVQVGATDQLAKDWIAQFAVFYGGGRGLDGESRLILPPYYGPGALASTTYIASRQDSFTTRVRVSQTNSPSVGTDFVDATAQEVWAHTFSRHTNGTIGAGVTYFRSHLADGTGRRDVFPSGDATVINTVPLSPGEALVFSAGARLNVRYDPFLQTTQPQVGAIAGAGWRNTYFGVLTTADAMTSIPVEPGDVPARQVTGSVTFYHQPSPVIRFEIGARGLVQDVPAYAAFGVPTTDFQWATFVAVVIQSPSAKF